MKNTIKRKKGFTLVEMLGVLAIIAILIALTAVGVMAAINRSRIVSTVANFKNYETALLQYVALNHSGGTVPLTNAALGDIKFCPDEDKANIAAPTQAQADGIHLGLVFYTTKTLERYPTWRVAEDDFTAGLIDVNVDWAWSTRIKAFSQELDSDGANGITPGSRTGNDWTDSIRCMSAIADNTVVPGTDDFTTEQAAWFTDTGVMIPNSSRVVYMDIPNLAMRDAKALSEELNGATLHDADLNAAQTRGRFVHSQATAGNVQAYYFLGAF